MKKQEVKKLDEQEMQETTGGMTMQGGDNMSGGMAGGNGSMGGSSVNPPEDWKFGNVFNTDISADMSSESSSSGEMD